MKRVSGSGHANKYCGDKTKERKKMPEVAKRTEVKRRAVNSDSGAKSKSPLSW
jgi:hypothetical protein